MPFTTYGICCRSNLANKLLVALAKEDSCEWCDLFLQRLLQHHYLGSASEGPAAITRLLEGKKSWKKLDGGYLQFTDVFFKRWLKEM